MVVVLRKVDIKGLELCYFVGLFCFLQRGRRDCHAVC